MHLFDVSRNEIQSVFGPKGTVTQTTAGSVPLLCTTDGACVSEFICISAHMNAAHTV